MFKNQSLQIVQRQLAQFAAQDNFETVMTTAFGNQLDRRQLQILRQQWLSGNFSAIPDIQILSQGELGAANGAYAASLDKIFVSSDFLAQASTSQVTTLILEELGHRLDQLLNGGRDSAGDEGEIFSRLVNGENLSPAALTALKAQNDHAVIDLGGVKVAIEQQIYIGFLSFPERFVGTIIGDYMNGLGGDDTLFGQGGPDTLYGGSGNDYLDGQNSNNPETDGNFLYGEEGDDALFGGGGNDILHGGVGNDYIEGSGGDDSAFGEDGNDLLVRNRLSFGGNGNDSFKMGDNSQAFGEEGDDRFFSDVRLNTETLFGGNGNDRFGIFANSALVSGGLGDDLMTVLPTQTIATERHKLYGDEGQDTIIGGIGMETISGGDGNDSINAGNGRDFVAGDAGDDTITDISGGDTIYGGAGNDSIESRQGSSVISGDDGNDYISNLYGNDTMYGGSGDDGIYDGAGSSWLIGGIGSDYLFGNGGDDHYIIDAGTDAGTDTINELVDGGRDLLDFSNSIAEIRIDSSITGVQFINNLVGLNGISQIEDIWGGFGNDTISSNALNNLLDGGGGDDQLYSGEGNDTVLGGNGADSLYGAAGDDYLFGGNGNDYINDSSGRNTLAGGNGDDYLKGTYYFFSNDSYFDGGGGNDTSEGAYGNDVYIIDADTDFGIDTILDYGDNDTIDVSSSSTAVRLILSISGFTQTLSMGVQLAANSLDQIENVIGGSGNDYLIGNGINNSFYGGSGDDYLNGGSGQDTLSGGNGNDDLSGNGKDSLVGGSGDDQFFSLLSSNRTDIDTLVGGVGNDSYEVNNSINVIVENFNEGIDLVSSSASYSLAANVENLTLTNIRRVINNINGTGNALNNIITGNDNNNILTGKAGNDVLTGNFGNDFYIIDADVDFGLDTIQETTTGGIDVLDFRTTTKAIAVNLGLTTVQTIAANVQLVMPLATIEYAYGGAGNDNITGNSLGNYLLGGAGDDTLKGGGGSDLLRGEAGADSFCFNGAALSGANTVAAIIGRDNVADFAVGVDKIALSKATFTAITSVVGGAIGSNFVSVATDAIALTGTQTAAIVYSQATGNLFYNQNGTAAGFGINGGNFAVLSNLPTTLAATDFVIVA